EPFRMDGDVDLHPREETLRILGEEHQPDVPRHRPLGRTVDDLHPIAELAEGNLSRLSEEVAPNRPQVLPDQSDLEIVEGGASLNPIVERHGGSQAKELLLEVTPRRDRLRTCPDIVVVDAVPLRERLRRLVRPRLSARSPEHENVLSFDDVRFDDRHIRRPDSVPDLDDL